MLTEKLQYIIWNYKYFNLRFSPSVNICVYSVKFESIKFFSIHIRLFDEWQIGIQSLLNIW